MGRKTNSMYTVCGQDQPHQMRPSSAVTSKTDRTKATPKAARKTVSVAKKVVPNTCS
jgi:hypothetical protein